MTIAIRELSAECNDKYEPINHLNMRGTKLRKHAATSNVAVGRRDPQLISAHMGHSVDIHNKFYKQRIDDHDVEVLGFLKETGKSNKGSTRKSVRPEKISKPPS